MKYKLILMILIGSLYLPKIGCGQDDEYHCLRKIKQCYSNTHYLTQYSCGPEQKILLSNKGAESDWTSCEAECRTEGITNFYPLNDKALKLLCHSASWASRKGGKKAVGALCLLVLFPFVLMRWLTEKVLPPAKKNMKEIEFIKTKLSERETEELLFIWTENKRDEWCDEAFDVIHQILTERDIEVPAQPRVAG